MSIFGSLVAQTNPSKGPSPEPKAETTPSPPPATDYDLRWGVKIPLRDKVELNATLYLPKTPDGSQPKTPVVFTLTPYISDSYHPRAAYFASHGYVFALVDVRGRGNSGGEFELFAQEPHDGHDVVEWLAQQPFCDGKVAMWGGSYAGFDQWATAKEFPPHLATIVPAAAVHPPYDYPSLDNVGYSYDMQWFTFTSGKASQQNLFGDSKFWRTKFLEAYKKHIAFSMLDSIVGNPSKSFQRILKHPTADSYYDGMVPTKEQLQKISLPILTITGQYDGDGAIVDLNDLHRQWYDWTMKNGAKPQFLKNQVAYYLLAPGNSGANGEWEYTDSYANLIANPKAFYLDSKNGDANGVFRSGTLTETKPSEGADQFVNDPLDTTRGENVEGVEPNDKTAGIDQRFALCIGKDGLVYHTEPFAKETPFVGCPKVSLSVSIDTPDTDLEADLYEIQPDGTSIGLWSDVHRLRYRESLREAKLVKAGEIVKCDFDPGLFVARRLMKGSRLRLVITSPNSIFWQKNYNSGGVVADETAKDARTAHVKVYHDAQHSSSIEMPLR